LPHQQTILEDDEHQEMVDDKMEMEPITDKLDVMPEEQQENIPSTTIALPIEEEEESMGSEFYEAEIYAHMGAGTNNTYGYGAFGGGIKSGMAG
jgi:hypothetical protein